MIAHLWPVLCLCMYIYIHIYIYIYIYMHGCCLDVYICLSTCLCVYINMDIRTAIKDVKLNNIVICYTVIYQIGSWIHA